MLFNNPILRWKSRKHLRKALRIAEEEKGNSVFAFDLDSTLFCMKYRTHAIIQSACADPLFAKKFPEYLDRLSLVRPTETGIHGTRPAEEEE